ncbi:DUF3099 domain-containing protein [Pseudonocardia sp. GCM10023141]|uniref:DUF3099 domain-containing protein n=1 Tax=Pseudonocardia sp. GCM10023141 TaxID=3252653 RepID=UPI00361A00B1
MAAEESDPVLITDAAPSFADEQHRRIRLYTILMVIHIVGFAVAGVLYYVAWWLGLVLIILTTPVPWIAVVLANSPSRRTGPAQRGLPPLRIEGGGTADT